MKRLSVSASQCEFRISVSFSSLRSFVVLLLYFAIICIILYYNCNIINYNKDK